MKSTSESIKSIIFNVESVCPSGCKGALVPEEIISGDSCFIFFGLNPSEAKDDLESDYTKDFYFIHPSMMKTRGQARWTAKLQKFLPEGAGAIQAEMLYWTSKNRKTLEERIGKLKRGNIYFDTSLKINLNLIEENVGATLVFLGFTHLDIIKEMFDVGEIANVLEGEKHTLIKCGNLGDKQIFAVRHPSAHGLTDTDCKKIQSFFAGQDRGNTS